MKNTDKVTLTVGQLKKLVSEAKNDNWSTFSREEANEEAKVHKTLDKVWNELDKLINSTKFNSKTFERKLSKIMDNIESLKDDYLDVGN